MYTPSFKMYDRLPGDFTDNGRSESEIAVDRFEQRNAHAFGKIMGLSSDSKYITVPEKSLVHMGLLVLAERVLGRDVLFISENAYEKSKIDQYAGDLNGFGIDATPVPRKDWGTKNETRVLMVQPHRVELAAVTSILPERFSLVVNSTENIRGHRMLLEIIRRSERAIFNTSMDIRDLPAYFERKVLVKKLEPDMVPFRSYDIYKRVADYLKIHNSRWVKRSQVLRQVMKEGEKYETLCFRMYDIKCVDTNGSQPGHIYMKKVKHCIYFKYHPE